MPNFIFDKIQDGDSGYFENCFDGYICTKFRTRTENGVPQTILPSTVYPKKISKKSKTEANCHFENT